MRQAALVALGGAVGSVLRWLLSGWVERFAPSPYPFGTLAVNILGSFAVGIVMTLATERNAISPEARLLLVTGVLGGFTTFSAYSHDTLALARNGQGTAATLYASGSIMLGLVAALAGRALVAARG